MPRDATGRDRDVPTDLRGRITAQMAGWGGMLRRRIDQAAQQAEERQQQEAEAKARIAAGARLATRVKRLGVWFPEDGPV